MLKVLEERTKEAREIEEGKKEIEKKKIELQKKEEEIIQKTKERAKEILEGAKEISREEKERIIKKAEEQARLMLREAKERIEVEIEKLRQKERQEIIKKSKEVLKEVLSESFDRALHRKYLQEVIEKLSALDFSSLKKKDVIFVEAVFAFPPRDEEEKAISNLIFKKIKNPVFKTRVDPELIAGVKISIEESFLIDASLIGKIEKYLYEK